MTRPDPSRPRDAAGFVRELRHLKGWVGNPSFEELSRRCGLPRSTLSDAASVRRAGLPRLDVVRGFVAACGVPGEVARGWERAWRDIQSAMSGSPALAAINPRELPPDVDAFVGRFEELSALDTLLDNGAGTVVTICGTAGVGKTALAVHWAYGVTDRFPDGQLHVNLCGYGARPPVTPDGALTTLLHSLKPPGAPIPAGAREQLALYRSLTADRRLLVVLDNAATPDDVRPLLPAGAESAVLVTSRDAMAALVARDGARRIDLAPLPAVEAVELLTVLVGDRAGVDPGAAAALAERCARLPLALRLAAERALSDPRSSLAALLDDLDSADPLDELDAAGDEQTSLRAVFSSSYRRLPGEAARAFRLLGLHPGRDYDAFTLAALIGGTLGEARLLIRTLARAHLLDEPVRGRFAMHDLLRAYAVELGEKDVGGDDAIMRLLDYYAHVATAAGDVAYPYPRARSPIVLATPVTPVPSLTSKTQALAWLDAERANLVTTAVRCDNRDWLITIADALGRYLNFCGYLADALVINDLALRAARASRDNASVGRTLGHLGLTYAQAGHLAEAARCLTEGRRLCQEVDDRLTLRSILSNLGLVYDALGQHDEARDALSAALDLVDVPEDARMRAAILNNLGLCHEHAARYQEALELYGQASARYSDANWRPGEGEVYYNIGSVNQRLGRAELALDYASRALAIAQETGSIEIEMGALNSIGLALCTLGRASEAVERHKHALSLARRVGDRLETARALDGLGTIAQSNGDADDARSNWAEALTIYVEAGVPQADDINVKLDDLERCPAQGPLAETACGDTPGTAKSSGLNDIQVRT